MRGFAFASLLVLAATLGACSAVDDFRKFTFTDGGTGRRRHEREPARLRPAVHRQLRPRRRRRARPPAHLLPHVRLAHRPGRHVHARVHAGTVASCSDYGIGVADCVVVEGIAVCLPHCDPSIGRNCRTNYSCCANNNVVTTSGDCAPSEADLCK